MRKFNLILHLSFIFCFGITSASAQQTAERFLSVKVNEELFFLPLKKLCCPYYHSEGYGVSSEWLHSLHKTGWYISAYLKSDETIYIQVERYEKTKDIKCSTVKKLILKNKEHKILRKKCGYEIEIHEANQSGNQLSRQLMESNELIFSKYNLFSQPFSKMLS